jgi:ribonuclease BN (tRNA processing enzyme)
MRLTILGSGTSIPHPRRRPPAYLLRSGDVSLLIDAGSGCSTGLLAAGGGLDSLSCILLTHLHPDHVVELVPIFFALHNPLGPARAAALPIWGPPGLHQHLGGLRSLYGRWIQPRQAAVDATEIDGGDVFDIGPLRVSAYRVAHHGACLAYRVESGGRSLCLSGDSGPCDGLSEAASASDVLVCECAALEGEGSRGHMSATDVGQLAARSGVGRVVLSHLYEHVIQSDPVSRVRRMYMGPVEMAEDGLEFEV